MADVYEYLAPGLPDSLPAQELARLRRHLGEEGGDLQGAYEYPLRDARGPARRIGGALVGELRPDDRERGLTVRQEAHAVGFDELRRIVLWLGARTTSMGAVARRIMPDRSPAHC